MEEEIEPIREGDYDGLVFVLGWYLTIMSIIIIGILVFANAQK